MTSKLLKQIKQTKPLDNLEVEAYLSLVLVSQRLGEQVYALLKEHDLSAPQYNVLRILRGAPAEGWACNEVSSRMVQRVPDITRLLDRLEQRGLVTRQRETADRRVVRARITEEGLRVLEPIDAPLARLHHDQLTHMGPEKLRQLINLLEETLQLP